MVWSPVGRYSASEMGAELAECPFCGSSVTEDLVIYGGTCPKCFAEIPGEEAATDPGEEVRAAQDRWDRFRARIPVFLGMTALLFVVSCTGMTALVAVLWPDPEVAEILDFDLDSSYPTPDLVGPATAEPAPTQDVPERPTPGSEASPSTPVAANDPPRPRPAAPTPRRPDGTVDLSLRAPTVRRDDNVVLSNPDAIRDMIGERMVEYIPGLKVCYDRRLKVAPTLKGRWRLKFTIATDGTISGADAAGIDKSDAELEACLVEHVVEHWRFGKISLAQPVQRTLRFFPN